MNDCINCLQKQRAKNLLQQEKQVIGRRVALLNTLKRISISWPFLKRPNNCSQEQFIHAEFSKKMCSNRHTWLLSWLDQVSPSVPVAMGQHIRFSSNTKKKFYLGLKPSPKPLKICFSSG